VLGAKQLGLLREFLPNAKVVGLLVNPGNPLSQDELEDVKAAATASGCRIEVANASSEAELEKAFASLAERSVEALIVGADPFMFARRQMVVALAMRHSLPAIFELREFATAGGLISYGASLAESYRQVGIYTGRIPRLVPLLGGYPQEAPARDAPESKRATAGQGARLIQAEGPHLRHRTESPCRGIQVNQTAAKCWICQSPAYSAEHRLKKADIVRFYGPGPYVGDDGPVHVAGGTVTRVQGPRSATLKYTQFLCHDCNTSRTQPYDLAYDRLISWVFANEQIVLQRRQSISTKCTAWTGQRCNPSLQVFREELRLQAG
jgi:ABC transporter substrate binding protein